jgi:hypothetical protein
MIQPLRTVHRRAFIALAVVLPTVMLAGLAARHPMLRAEAHAAQVSPSRVLLRSEKSLWQKHAIQTKFYRDSQNRERIDVVLDPKTQLNEPDLLLYWTENEAGDSLPEDARFLGKFSTSTTFSLPSNAGESGHLILYSLAHQEVFDRAALEPVR